jgi:hypothetical protein
MTTIETHRDSRLPKGFRFMVVRRVSKKLWLVHIKLQTGIHSFFHRGGLPTL